jgi:hypothetical protein
VQPLDIPSRSADACLIHPGPVKWLSLPARSFRTTREFGCILSSDQQSTNAYTPLQALPGASSPELSRSPLNTYSSQSATPYSWPPTIAPTWSAPPAPPGFIYDANMQLVPYNPPPTNPWAPHPGSESTGSKRKSSAAGKQKGGKTKKKRGSNETGNAGDAGDDEDAGGASNERGYARWDRQNDDGLTSEGCLVQWMSGGGWRKWRNAKSTGEKEKCYREINAHLQEHGHTERTPDSILAKFKTLENSYKKALIWKHSTG